MANQERDPRAYELMTVFVPDISEEDTQAQVEKVSGYISNAGGNLTETLTDSPWGRRRLAYTIRFNGTDYRDGFYTVYHFDSRPSDLTELERDLKLDTTVMRYLLVHDDPKAGEKPTEDEDEAAEGEAAPAEAAEAQAEQAAESAQATETPAVAAPVAEAQAEPATAGSAPAEEASAEPAAAEEASAAAPEEAATDEAAPAEASDDAATADAQPEASESNDDAPDKE